MYGYGQGGADYEGYRVSDVERDRAIEALTEHFVAGRLDQGEYSERQDAATTAKRRGDLDRLFRDLPPLGGRTPASVMGHVAAQQQRAQRSKERASTLKITAIVILVAIGITGLTHFPWVPILAVLMVVWLLRRR